MFEMTNSNKSVFIDRNTSHIKHGWQEKRMIMAYNACVSCALIGHNFSTVLQLPTGMTKIVPRGIEFGGGWKSVTLSLINHVSTFALHSHIAHFLRYNRRKWKTLVG